MSALTDFLTARLDEDAAAANDFHDALRCDALDRDGGFDLRWCNCGYPARVLREVDAKRKILAEYQAVLDDAHGVGDSGRRPRLYGRYDGLDHALKALAAVWSG